MPRRLHNKLTQYVGTKGLKYQSAFPISHFKHNLGGTKHVGYCDHVTMEEATCPSEAAVQKDIVNFRSKEMKN